MRHNNAPLGLFVDRGRDLPRQDNSAMVPRRPGYARNDTGGFLTTAGSMKY